MITRLNTELLHSVTTFIVYQENNKGKLQYNDNPETLKLQFIQSKNLRVVILSIRFGGRIEKNSPVHLDNFQTIWQKIKTHEKKKNKTMTKKKKCWVHFINN